MHLTRALLVLLAAAPACRRAATPPPAPHVPPPPRVTADDAAVPAPRDAAIPAPRDAAPPLPARAPDVDLIRARGLSVTVSSTVANASDRPEHLVDGDLATAWNSRTGDLAGAWFEVAVPDGARVTSLAMTAGYTRTGRHGDLFVMNQRVRRVRVARDGAALGEFDLDVDRRDPQTLPVTGGAGVYRVTLLALQPGSQASWREACVSDFRVMGSAPPAGAPAAPVVTVFDPAHPAAPPWHPPPPRALAAVAVASPALWCRQMAREQDHAACRRRAGEMGEAVCSCATEASTDGEHPVGTAVVHGSPAGVIEARLVLRAPSPEQDAVCDLLIHTGAGWFGVAGVAACERGAAMVGDVRRMRVRQFVLAGGDAGAPALRLAWTARQATATSPEDIGEGEPGANSRGPLPCDQDFALACDLGPAAPECTVRETSPERCSYDLPD